MKRKWFDEYGNILRQIPDKTVRECSHSGECDKDVEFWQAKLEFDCPRDLAIQYLQEFGAWEREELLEKTEASLSQIVLWVACGQIKENGEWFGMAN